MPAAVTARRNGFQREAQGLARIVMKFGGTSMAGTERIRRVANIVRRQAADGNQVAVVVSAMAGETNNLDALAREMCGEVCRCEPRWRLVEDGQGARPRGLGRERTGIDGARFGVEPVVAVDLARRGRLGASVSHYRG